MVTARVLPSGRLSAQTPASVRVPRAATSPVRAIGRRVLIAASVLLAVVLVVYLDRDGYRDVDGSPITLLDATYYATVSLSTTGYGDITPVTPGARLLNILFITPARVLFLIVLVGTTLEVLTERSREALRVDRWRKRVRDHVVVIGYGTKGRSAVRALLGQGTPRDHIVVVDPDTRATAEAESAGLVTVCGPATRTDVLRSAEVDRARAVIVGTNTDEANVLITLTARELSPAATIVASVREAENAHLLEQSGADTVITSSDAAGRLLGLSTQSPRLVAVVEDLLTTGAGLDVFERPVAPGEVGKAPRELPDPVIAVVRDGHLLRHSEPAAARLRDGDAVICVCGNEPDGAKTSGS